MHEKPYEHDTIIGTLHDTLFGGSRTITQQFPAHFKPDEERTHTLSPAMVALAATSVSIGVILQTTTKTYF